MNKKNTIKVRLKVPDQSIRPLRLRETQLRPGICMMKVLKIPSLKTTPSHWDKPTIRVYRLLEMT